MSLFNMDMTLPQYYEKVWERIQMEEIGPQTLIYPRPDHFIEVNSGVDQGWLLTKKLKIPIVQKQSLEYKTILSSIITTAIPPNCREYIVLPNPKKLACKVKLEEIEGMDKEVFVDYIWGKFSEILDGYYLCREKKLRNPEMIPWVFIFTPSWDRVFIKKTSNQEGEDCISFPFLPVSCTTLTLQNLFVSSTIRREVEKKIKNRTPVDTLTALVSGKTYPHIILGAFPSSPKGPAAPITWP